MPTETKPSAGAVNAAFHVCVALDRNPESWQEDAANLIDRESGLAELVAAGRALIDDVRRRYPGEKLRCQFMRQLDAALAKVEGK